MGLLHPFRMLAEDLDVVVQTGEAEGVEFGGSAVAAEVGYVGAGLQLVKGQTRLKGEGDVENAVLQVASADSSRDGGSAVTAALRVSMVLYFYDEAGGAFALFSVS